MSEQTNAVERAALVRLLEPGIAGTWLTPGAARRVQAALAAAMPTTTTEWGVRYEADRDTEVHEARESEAEARAQVAVSPTDTALVSREVTEWREVTP